MVDRAVYVFAMAIETDQEAACSALPEKAKPKQHDQARRRVLNAYLGLDHTNITGRFRDPAAGR